MAPIISRSCCSRYLATVQPSFSVPTRLASGTCTRSKKVSQNGLLPLISRMGLVLTPGLVMSISTKLMPVCFLAVSVRTRQKIQSASSA